MTPEEQKKLKKALLIRLGIFVVLKVGWAVILHQWAKSLGDHDFEVPAVDDIPIDGDLWYINPYTTKISDGSLGGLIRVSFDKR